MKDFIANISQHITPLWNNYIRIALDILIVSFIFYLIYKFLTKTKAIQLLKGVFIIILIAAFAYILNLETLEWLMINIGLYGAIAIIILFQPELRRLITQFGQRNWISNDSNREAFPLDELVNAVVSMADEKVGSLIVIERNTGLKNYAESGVIVNADISEEFIRTIFYPLTPLHDGAIIIQEGRIASAASYLPLSDSKQLKKFHGARHRAALGIAEETDALAIITSEESGAISIMVNGKIHSKIKMSDIKNMILFFLNPKTAYEEKYKIK